MTSSRYADRAGDRKPLNTSRQRVLKLERTEILTIRDNGIRCEPDSPCQFSSSMNTAPVRRLDFSSVLSPSNKVMNADSETVTKVPPSRAKRLRQQLQASSQSATGIGRVRTAGRQRKRRLFTILSSNTSDGVSVTTAPSENDAKCHWQRATTDCGTADLLVGDFSRPCSLPVVSGKHVDLHSISPDTLAHVLCNKVEFVTSDQVLIVDCRYPYEYEAGHIKGAINIYTKSSLISTLLQSCSAEGASDQCPAIVIFHCEFSSKRGPSLARFLRQCDRAEHVDVYPSLSYPELYVLEGGYKAFHERHSQLCSARNYVPMLQPGYEDAVCRFRAECKRDSRVIKQRRRISCSSSGQSSLLSDIRPLTLRF